jgi:hypothetical protein
MYIVINSDINLTIGQACAQTSHVTHLIIDEIVRSVYESSPVPEYYIKYLEWCIEPTTIIKKVTNDQLMELKKLPYTKYFYDDIYDKKSGTKHNYLTVVGFYPGCITNDAMKKFNLL